MVGSHRLRFSLFASRCCALLLALAMAGCAGAPEPGGQRAGLAGAAQEAEIAAAMGNRSEAVALLGRAAEQAPSDLTLQIRYARALAETGRISEALAVAQAARARGLPSRPIDGLIGRLQVQSGNGPGAEQTFQRLVADSPDDAAALNGLGLARVLRGDLAGAESAFRQAVSRTPGDLASRNNLGLALALHGREDLAVPMLEQLRQEVPGSRRVRHNLALAYAASGQTANARALLEADLPGAQADEAVRAYAGLADGVPARPRMAVAAAPLPPASDQAEAADAEPPTHVSRRSRRSCHHACRSGHHALARATTRAQTLAAAEPVP